MKNSARTMLVGSLAVVAVGLAMPQASYAQSPKEIKRNILLKQDASVAGREAIVSTVVIPPGAVEPKHTHPADLMGYVRSGVLTVDIEGKPTQTIKAGQAFFIEANKVHWGSNKGKAPASVVAVFYTEKGQPLTSPAK